MANLIPFDYDLVRDAFECFTVEEVTHFAYNGKVGDALGELKLIVSSRYTPVIEVRNTHVVIGNGDYDTSDPKAMSWLVTSAVYDNTYGWGENLEAWPEGDNVLFELNENDVTSQPLVLGGVTDFYSRRGWWPHQNVLVEVKNLKKAKRFSRKKENLQYEKIFPMTYVGELRVEGRTADIFAASDDLVPLPDSFEIDDWLEKGMTAIFQDSEITSDWVLKLPLNHELDQVTATAKRFVAYDKWPYAPMWLQEYEGFKAPFNHFVTQIALVNYPDLPRIYTNGYWYLFWDGKNEFKCVYQNS